MPDAASPDPSSVRALYVYYRVRAGQEVPAQAAIETMQATLRPLQPGLQTRLMCRVGDAGAGSDATWMEVYEHPDGVSHACEAMLQTLASALPGEWFASQRHVEVFAPLT